ncbi:hypothetical protein F5144DRAFT_567164 [Chaetomium tenue]|uniref:Uncharacterized protein n=1 Tax=Chaetomium tenue TaxID=1854479 RepID=A0ACB7PDK3_9PEZI|nr:hypothetical protein F5144DRAFT_567164 [Chaetomium globosum]
MESQTTESPSPSEPPQNNTQSYDTPLPAPEQISVSVPALRFPRPQGSQLLANWVSSSAPDIRQPSIMSDNGSLADSAYEIVNGTDNESQDDRLTESTCSLTASRPDDVHSLDGSSVGPYNTDSDDESDHPSRSSSIRYADQALQNPSTQLPNSSLEHGSSTEGSGVVVRSIQFQESDAGDTALEENISAKHAIVELDEEDSSTLAESLGMPNAPKRWVASIRQTMSQSYLSTKEPLRVLYVGPPEAQRAIVLKICSAIWESPQSNAQDYLGRHRDGVYNIIPISSFGPSPELDLMEASLYQIKVEHCTSAEELIGPELSPTGEAGYSITIEQEKDYRSLVLPAGPAVVPEWELPHVAVLYCSIYDDIESSGTRHAAWSFMERHGVPSILIADKQDFRNPDLGKYINEHSVHLCLESRDPERPTAPLRFPIDYHSFADIDARQMNRHLAYLTGLSKTEDKLDRDSARTKEVPKSEMTKGAKGRPSVAREEFGRRLRSLLPVAMLLMGPFFVLSMVDWLWPTGLYQTQPLSFTGVCVSSQISPAFTTGSSSVATSTKTVVINVTSTKTVQAIQTQQPTSTFASALSLAGFLSDKPSVVPADIEAKDKKPSNSNKTACSVRVHSLTEILVGVPSRNKAVWLAAGSIDITVRRNDHPIKTKISSVDEGVLVELERRDAYGLVNITVVTTRRPRINETFEIDFGKSALAELAETIGAGLNLLQGVAEKVTWAGDASQIIFDNACKRSRDYPGHVASALEHASKAVQNRTDAVKRAASNARERVARQIESAGSIRKEADLSVLQAQIASRLWWLRMQGRTEEYAEYKRNASRFLNAKHLELQAAKTKNTPNQSRSFYGLRSALYTPWKKDSARRNEGNTDSASQDGGWEYTWRKIVQGK